MADKNDCTKPVIPDEVTDSGLIELAGRINSKYLKDVNDDRMDYIINKIIG